jgi:cytochrome c-type biogenesis protein CcmE
MSSRKVWIKVWITICIVASSVGYMVYTTVSSGSALEYYKHVEEVAGEAERWKDERLQLHGNVIRGSVLKKPGSLDYKFALHSKGKWVEVTYSGIVPDGFKECGELIAKGKLSDGRSFLADELSAKCPSKYEERRDPAHGCGDELRAAVLSHRTASSR